MAIRKQSDGRPQILEVSPVAAIPGGEFQIRGKGLAKTPPARVRLGEVPAQLVIGSDSLVVIRVPDGASVGELVVGDGDGVSAPYSCEVGVPIADGMYAVGNPAVDRAGNIYCTLSGPRGQKTPVSVFQIDLHYNAQPFVSDVMNATGLAVDREGMLYVSSRFEGSVYQIAPNGQMSIFVEGMGVATGIAFDDEDNLYVGDRSGTIFKISPSRQIYVFATLEPSIAAYHLAFGPEGYLYVTGPTTSSYDCVHRISHEGVVEVFYRGVGRPQGMAFDVEGNLYVCASHAGRRGVVRIDPERKAELFLSGNGIVGLAFLPSRSLVVCTQNAIYRADVGIKGRI